MKDKNKNNELDKSYKKLEKVMVISEVLEELYKELNNIIVKEYNDRNFIYSTLIRRGFCKSIECILKLKNKELEK
jgi:tryptophan 2,3-dioxygenase